VNLAYSSRNRSAAIRIPTTARIQAKRLEYRPPDPAANLTSLLRVVDGGLDGIQNKIDSGEPLDKNIYELPPEELRRCRM